MSTPKRIKILGKYYKVVPTKHGDYGSCDVSKCEIELLASQSPQQKRDTLLHEAIHAFDDTMQLGLTEEQVHSLAGGVYALLSDNPKFARWLIDG